MATKRQAEADAAEHNPVRIGARPLGYVPKAVRNAGDPKRDPRIMRADVLAASVMDDLMAEATAGLAFSFSPRGKENDEAEGEDRGYENGGVHENGGHENGVDENGDYANGGYGDGADGPGSGVADGGVDDGDEGIPKAVAASGFA